MTRSPGSLFLALDQGGGSSRALAFDSQGSLVVSAAVPVAEVREGEDQVEQDPEELVASLRTAAESCAGALGGPGRIAAAGLATQRSSVVCWDRATGAALSPVLSWQDRRAAAWLAGFAAESEAIRRATGLFLSPHYGASKLRWCLDHLEPVRRAREEGRLAMGPLASFLAFRLLDGRPFIADPANASRTLLWSIRTRAFDPDLLSLFGIPREVLPECVPTRGDLGTVRIAGAELPFRVLTGDQSAAIFAAGPPRADTAYANFGTGAFVQRVAERAPLGFERLLASLVLADPGNATFVVEGTINGAGSAVRAVAEDLGLGDVDANLDFWLRDTSEPPLFLNGVSGLAAPYWVPAFRSRFVGGGRPEARIVAVVESILFLVRAILDEMALEMPPPARIQASGGLARVDGLCARLAALAGVPVDRAGEPEATARGLAWLLSGVRVPWPDRAAPARFAAEHDPALEARFRRWRSEMHRALGRPD